MDEKTELLKRVGIRSLLSLVALCGRVVDNAVLFLTSSALTEYKIFFAPSMRDAGTIAGSWMCRDTNFNQWL